MKRLANALAVLTVALFFPLVTSDDPGVWMLALAISALGSVISSEFSSGAAHTWRTLEGRRSYVAAWDAWAEGGFHGPSPDPRDF